MSPLGGGRGVRGGRCNYSRRRGGGIGVSGGEVVVGMVEFQKLQLCDLKWSVLLSRTTLKYCVTITFFYSFLLSGFSLQH